ncbi:MAG: preprotein translocase subunit SecA [Deltaproteobacteria bacterium]|nr:MAG: preprotein translocase subunit SecA [Deltaproteobacteria bacterium]
MFEGLTQLAKKVFGDANEREIRKLRPMVARINDLESKLESLSDEKLAARTADFKLQIENGKSLDDILPDAFATVREASKRTLGMRHYDVQLIGGQVLHGGRIAEMKTGEGKTLVATLPIYLNALSGKGVHLVTVNDYLAERDADWMGEIYRFLGMSVGKILSDERNPSIKRKAYAADITYGTNNEFGFDYLRDNMKYSLDEYVQRGHNFAIVDEVDSILIDEARTPLIISGPAESNTELYSFVDAMVPLLQVDVDFTLDEKSRNVTLTETGITKLEQRLGVDNLYDDNNMMLLHHVNQSLKAHHLFKRDKDYVVRGDEVIIVDEHTGRLMSGRRWSDGLHQAMEAKERVRIQPESQTYATITFQNYFRMYDKLGGMTGTAETEAAELADIYDLEVVVIPTNRPIARLDHEDVVYKTQMEKYRAVLTDIREKHERGQPVLVGTTSVENSERVAKLLQRAKIPHEVLNAKQHNREAGIVAQAGRIGAVTISTNMAGRGTDIKLGGNPEEMAKSEADPDLDPQGYAKSLERFRVECAEEEQRVLQAGGLHIVGTERHESRRIDNQLRGRSGRQGDPGSSKFFLSLEDDLLRIFGSDKITIWMERMGLKDDEPIEHRWITRALENAQKKVEGHHFQVRKNLLEYDDVMNYQRKGVYDLRKRALAGDGIRELIDEAVENVTFDLVDETCIEGVHPEHWQIGKLRERIEAVFGLAWEDTDDEIRDHARNELRQRLHREARDLIAERLEAVGEEPFLEVARMYLLQYVDQLWKDHLLAMDRLRQGVGLRAYGQRNPLLEYKREAFHMFQLMSAMRDEMLLEQLCKVDLAVLDAAAQKPSKQTARQLVKGGGAFGLDQIREAAAAARAAAAGGGGEIPELALPYGAEDRAPRRPSPGDEARQFAVKVGLNRNDPCPCGSGLKFKRCCGEGFTMPAVAPVGETPGLSLEEYGGESSSPSPSSQAPEGMPSILSSSPLDLDASFDYDEPTDPDGDFDFDEDTDAGTVVEGSSSDSLYAAPETGDPVDDDDDDDDDDDFDPELALGLEGDGDPLAGLYDDPEESAEAEDPQPGA